MSIKVSEFGFIESIRKDFESLVPEGVEGIGDDCAVIPTSEGRAMVVSCDMLSEGVHFLRGMDSYSLGVRAVEVNVSDVAAMGVRPQFLLLSIGVARWVTDEWLRGFMEGVRSSGVALIGGDTTRSEGGLTISITAMGEGLLDNIKRRSGAKCGDTILVTGELGESAASEYQCAVSAEVEEGVWLGTQNCVTSMMDISDGIAGDITHIMHQSKVGATIECTKVPLYSTATLSQGLSGGEDFKLLLTAKSSEVEKLQGDFHKRFSKELYAIGTITDSCELLFTKNGEKIDLGASGFQHF